MVLVGALPLLLAWPVPLQDWANHVAGAHVLAALLDGDPFWQRFYRFNTFLVPNAAVDLGLLGLRAAGFSEAVAANLFILATYGVFMTGMVGLSRALRSFDATKVALAVLLFYGATLFWGLVNYVLAVGLMWGFLAAWLRAERDGARVAIAMCGAAGLVFVHAVPAMVFPLLLACFDAARWRSGAPLRSCASAPVALAVVVTILRSLPGQTGHDLVPVYFGAGSFTDCVLWKLRLFGTIPFGGSLLQDGASLVAWLGCALAIGLAARPRLTAGAALGVVAVFLLVLVVPERLGTGSLLDVRLGVLPVMLAAMAVRLRWRGPAAARACVAVVVLLVAVRSAVIAVEWVRASTVFADFEEQAAKLPPGSLMVMAYGRPRVDITWVNTWSPPIQSIAAQVVAHGVFFPALFANPDQQPIARRPEFDPLGQPRDFSDAAHREKSLAGLGALCGRYNGVFVTVLYGATPFLIEDACAP